MATRSTYILVDDSHDAEVDSSVACFVFSYCITPINFNRSNKTALLKFPYIDPQPNLEPLNWATLSTFIRDITKKSRVDKPHPNGADLIASISDFLQSLQIRGINKQKSCDVIVISPFRESYNWNKYKPKIIGVLQAYQNLNLICIDSSAGTPSKYHDDNMRILQDEIINANEYNERSLYCSIIDALLVVTKSEMLTPKFKKPVEIYSYNLSILGLPDLEFLVSAYPFVKKNTMADYVTLKRLNKESKLPVTNTSKYYYTKFDESKDEPVETEITSPEFVFEGYKFGTSNFLLTDLPPGIFQAETVKSMIITSFFPKETLPPWYLKNDTLIIFPFKTKAKKDDIILDRDTAMFSELWQAMAKKGVCANVRFVKKAGADVKYGVLFPQGYKDYKTTHIDFGCFIFVETIFQDDEKLVSLPNLTKIEVEEKLQSEMDDMLDDINLDKDESDELFPFDSMVVEMNQVTMNDMFYYLRDTVTEYEDLNERDFDRVTKKLRKTNNPLLSFERLIYLISAYTVYHHFSEGGHPSTPLYDMFSNGDIPTQFIDVWNENAKEGSFIPNFSCSPKTEDA